MPQRAASHRIARTLAGGQMTSDGDDCVMPQGSDPGVEDHRALPVVTVDARRAADIGVFVVVNLKTRHRTAVSTDRAARSRPTDSGWHTGTVHRSE